MTQTAKPSADGRAVDRRARRDPLRLAASGLGQLLVTVGFVVLLFVAYELWGTGLYTAHQQGRLRHELALDWQGVRQGGFGTVAAPVYDHLRLGHGVAVLYVPALGKHYHYVVVEGVDEADLQKGPGHYPGTALPGQIGNLVVSGHRTTYLAPFNRIDRLRPGDNVVFETAIGWYVYRVSNVAAYHLRYQEIVDPSDIGESWPVPNRENARPTQRIFTFTTCNPKYSAAQRLIVHGVFVRAVAKPGPPPPEIDTPRS